MAEKYYIGIDIGTDSCGWAVTDEEYNIKKFKGNAMWGVRLFDESKTAEERRAHRTSRRRLDRRNERLAWLETIFADEISKIDRDFFVRLKESSLHFEDKTVKGRYSIFEDEYTDKSLHMEYPTIYRLRRELIENPSPHDVRLVFLVLHHIIKYRGHFLFDDLDVSEVGKFKIIFERLTQYCIDNLEGLDFTTQNIDELEKLVGNRNLGKNAKKNEFAKLYGITKKSAPQQFSCLGLISGTSEKLADVFNDDSLKDVEKKSICFSDKYEENSDAYASILGERFEFIEILKAIYDFGILADILQGEKYISVAMDKKYKEHYDDLKLLKSYVKKYCTKDTYNEIFKTSKKSLYNYVAYSGHIKKNGKTGVLNESAKQEDFCSYLKKTLGECKNKKYSALFAKIETATLCPKQRVGSNGVIPMQIHRAELLKILENAREYLPFLTVADESGITAEQKIINIFDYKIPYYVGPLNRHSDKAWLVRTDEKITPWNIHNVVDYDASAEAFINNLTNKCTYLPQYDVIPKNSILYSKFAVLNEINSLKIDGEPISVSLKQEIFNELALKRNKITQKGICGFLRSKNINFTTLTGVDEEIKSNMKSYRDLERFENLTVDEKDDIIKAITVFGEEKRLLKKRIREKYGDRLDDKSIGYIAKLNYSGWGRLSVEFLTEIMSIDESTGELVSIMDALWSTNYNLMQLIYSEKYNFEEAIEDAKEGKENTSLRRAVEQLYVSPKIKRPIYQALQIVKEIVRTQEGKAPEKIFLEVARFEGEKKRTKSRKTQLQELLDSCKNDYVDVWSELSGIEDDKLKSDKLFLYFSQCGRCMYTGERIDLDELMRSNSLWDIDHIYPQSKIKDDSLHNNRVLSRKDYNSDIKGSRYPISTDTREKMKSHWQYLLDKGLINAEKYNRLICRNELTDEQLGAFINRQLVETQQSTKAIAEILKNMYNEAGTEIVYVKAGLVSDFRHDYEFIKSRDVNDFHHAKDAYLNIVVGNVYNVQCTHNRANFIKGLKSDDKNSYSMNGMFKFNVRGAWDRNVSMDTVKKYMAKNNILYTRYSYKQKGELFKQQLVKKGSGQVPIKAAAPFYDSTKYGRYNSPSACYFCLAEFIEKGIKVRGVLPIDLYKEKEYAGDPEQYISNAYGVADVKILIPCIKYNSCFEFNGFRMHLSSKSTGGTKLVYKPAVQLVLGLEREAYIKKISNYLTKNSNRKVNAFDKLSCEENIAVYDEIERKLTDTVFKNNFEVVRKIVVQGRDKFICLDIETQCFVLGELLKILHANVMSGDLEKIGGAKHSGIVTTNSRISGIKRLKSAKLINQSVTGLYESEIDLLK